MARRTFGLITTLSCWQLLWRRAYTVRHDLAGCWRLLAYKSGPRPPPMRYRYTPFAGVLRMLIGGDVWGLPLMTREQNSSEGFSIITTTHRCMLPARRVGRSRIVS